MKIFFTLFSLFLSSLTTLSAYCPENNPVCWRGLYLNGQLGGSWNKQSAKFTNANFFNTLGPTIVGSKFELNSTGFIGGAALGYNTQMGCCVLGIETGILGTHLKKRRPSPFFPEIDTFSYKVNWLAFTKLRAGYAYKRCLPYITGGWSGGFLDMRFEDFSSNVSAKAKKWGNGLILGAGCDYKLTRCSYVGIAYDFFWLWYRNERTGCPTCGTGVGFGTPNFDSNAYTHALTLRFGINL